MTPQRSASWLSVHVSVQKFLLVAVMMMCHVSLSNAFVPHSRLLQLHRTPQLEQNHKKTLDLKKVQRTVLNAGYGRIDIAAVKPKTRPYHLVLVESPSKCSTISKILNKYVKDNNLDFDYVVVATMGHVRNLPRSGKNQTVVGVDVHNQYQPTYEILPGKEGLVKDLQSLAKDAQQIVLATDEDREGEAIAWHTSEILPPELPRVRVTFTEITPSAILHSIQHPREIDMDLVDAQETRRVLDRIAGYTLSPLLWKKIAPGLSAGRVQSVGMALVVQRERERLKHVPVAYWDLKAAFDGNVTAILVQLNGQDIAKGGDFDNTGHLVAKKKLHMEEQLANDVLQSMAGGEVNSWLQDPNKSTWTVTSVKSRERSNKPPVPFITSTLQQESVRRLGMSVSQAMSCAQKLYEAGFISYMRTDSTHMSNDAQSATTDAVTSQFGEPFLVPPKEDKKKSKNAQESHEAIRPAIQASGGFYESRDLVEKVSEAELQLYELIFNRTLASRMTPQVLNSTSMEIEGVSVDGQTTVLFRLSGSVIVNPGFTLAYGGKSSDASLLPPWQEGMELNCEDLSSVGHETKPPARYTEASFVKELETLGVGRPSTYAGTVQILRDRAYVGTPVRADGSKGKGREKERKGTSIIAGRAAGGSEFTDGGRGPLVPSLSAFVVCSLLEKHLSSYVDPTFTAGMEDTLDVIAQGDEGADRIAYLDEFYGGEEGLAATVKRVDETIESDEARKAQLPGLLTSSDNSDESISLMIGPWGPYIQKTDAHTNEKLTTAQLPAGMASDLSTITPQSLATLLESREKNGVVLGHHPTDGREIRLKVGRYGAYLQWGSEGADDTTNHSLPRHMGNMRNLDFSSEDGETSLDSMIGLSFDDAVKYVGLPREVCVMKELPVIAAIGPYGPYLKYNNTFASLRKSDSDVLTIEEKEANIIVTERIIEKKAGMQNALAELGEMEGSPVRVKNGRFGMYINWKKVNAKMPVEYTEDPESLPLDKAWSLIQTKQSTSGGGKGKKKSKTAAPEIELPPAPKRPMSAYLFFCDEKRSIVSQTTNTLGETSKELARLWALTADDPEARKVYVEKNSEAKEIYQTKLHEWEIECKKVLEASGVSSKRVSAGKGRRKVSKISSSAEMSKPKRPKSSYLFFCAEHRPLVSKTVKSLGDISKELARMWAETEGTDERKPFEEQAAADKVRYQTELQAGDAGVAIEDFSLKSTISNGSKKKGKSSKRTSPVAASSNKTMKSRTVKGTSMVSKSSKTKKKRSRSAYMIFCSAHRASIVDEEGNKLSFGETTKELARRWRECDDATKAKFEEEAGKEKQSLQEA